MFWVSANRDCDYQIVKLLNFVPGVNQINVCNLIDVNNTVHIITHWLQRYLKYHRDELYKFVDLSYSDICFDLISLEFRHVRDLRKSESAAVGKEKSNAVVLDFDNMYNSFTFNNFNYNNTLSKR